MDRRARLPRTAGAAGALGLTDRRYSELPQALARTGI